MIGVETLSKENPSNNTLIRRIWERLTTTEGTPRDIAVGFALGLIVGMTPFLGFHILGCVLLSALFKGRKLAAIIGVNITNIVTAPLIYPINYWVGLRFAGISDDVKWSIAAGYSDILKLMMKSPLILADLFIGGMILGIPLAVIGYFGTLKIVALFQKR